MTQSTPAAAPAAPAAATPATPSTPAAPAAAPLASLIPDAPAAPAAAAAAAPAATPAAPAAAPEAAADPNSGNAWLFAEGVLGAGDRPAWFKSDKYATVAAQAEAYTHLESRFGSFTGAPKDGKYDTALPDDAGVELVTDHPLLGSFQKWAGENQLSQKGFTELMGMLGQYEAQNIVDMGAVKSQLGEKADERITAAAQWAQANLDPEGYQTFRSATSLANAADVFKVIESVIAKTGQVRLPKPGADVFSAQPEGLERIKAEHGKRDATGGLLYNSDPAHRAKVEKAYNEYYAKAS